MNNNFKKLVIEHEADLRLRKLNLEEQIAHHQFPSVVSFTENSGVEVISFKENDEPNLAVTFQAIEFYDDNNHGIPSEIVDSYLQLKEQVDGFDKLNCDIAANTPTSLDTVLVETALSHAVFKSSNPKTNSPYFLYRNGALVYYFYDHENQKKSRKVSNFDVKICNEGVKYSREDKYGNRVKDSVYTLQILTPTQTFTIKIPSANVFTPSAITSKAHAKAFVENDGAVLLKQYINKLIEANDYPKTYEYESNGWTRLDNGKLVYLTNNGCLGSSFTGLTGNQDFCFEYDPYCSEEESANFYLSMLNVTKDHKVPCILMLESLLGCMNTLFETAGFPNKKAVFIVGPTQSKKTTLALLFTKIYDRNNLATPHLSFSSTACGIEEQLAQICDASIVLDDLAPKQTRHEMNIMFAKLEQVVRAVGDRVPKHRMTRFASDTQEVYLPVKSSVIITGELLEGMQSSLARLVQLELDKTDVNIENLTLCQQRPLVVPTFVYYFIKYLTQNSDGVINYITETVSKKRTTYTGTFKTPRFDEYLAIYETVIEILCSYLQRIPNMNQQSIRTFKDFAYNTVQKVLTQNDESIQMQSVATTICTALQDAVVTGKIPLYHPNSDDNYSLKKIIITDESYIIYPSTLIDFLREYYRERDLAFYYQSTKSLTPLLESAKIIESRMEGMTKRYTFKINNIIKGSSSRFYFLSRKIIDAEN